MANIILNIFIVILMIAVLIFVGYMVITYIREAVRTADEREKNYNDLMNACNELLDKVNKED